MSGMMFMSTTAAFTTRRMLMSGEGGVKRGNWSHFPKMKCYSTNTPSGSTSGSSNADVDLSGVFPPIPTPFNSKDQIDFGQLQRNFKHWNSIPFAGYVVMGSNGEAVALERNEKMELLRNVRQLAGSKKVIAGLGMSTASQTIELCNSVADENSADAALIITPSFFKGQMTSLVLKKYYEEVADKSRLPIILYSVPGNTSIDLTPDVASALAPHPNCIGMKDSGGDITKIAQIVHETNGTSFQFLAGSAGFFLPSLLMGCVGGICALANVLGAEVCELYRLFQQNRLQDAVSLQKKLIVPNLLVTKVMGVPGLKASMDATGQLYGGLCRSPLLPLESQQLEQLLSRFAQNGFPLDLTHQHKVKV